MMKLLYYVHIKFLAENPTVHLSYSTFTRMRQKEMISVSYSSRKTCLCEKHQNFSLKLVPLINMQLINTVNPDVFRKRYTTDEKLDEVLDKIDTEEIKFSQWKRINVEKDGKTTKKIKLSTLPNRLPNLQPTSKPNFISSVSMLQVQKNSMSK